MINWCVCVCVCMYVCTNVCALFDLHIYIQKIMANQMELQNDQNLNKLET